MRKIITTLVLITTVSLTGCGETEQLQELQSKIDKKQIELQDINNKLDNSKEVIAEKGQARYILTVETGQSHFNLSISDHLKDAVNMVEYDIAVDKEYYESLNVGDSICNEFRTGSFITSGSIGSWDIKVKDKKIE